MSIMHAGILLAKCILQLASVISVGVMLERVQGLRRARVEEEADFSALKAAFKRHSWDEVRGLAVAARGASGRALQAGLDHGSEDPEIIREAIAQGVVVQTAALQQNMVWLATIASTAPYVGLFGTVLGILDAFQTIAVTGKTGAAVVAGGISEALITTALGLGVAIPAVMAYNAFNSRVNSLSLIIETHSIDLASRLAPAVHGAAPTELNGFASSNGSAAVPSGGGKA